jgi:threonine dehydrogenase-like Zn-dependent dehydrogenase
VYDRAKTTMFVATDHPHALRQAISACRKGGTLLLERIERGEIDPSFIITHRIGLEDAPEMYRTFRDKDDSCIKVVMTPGTARIGSPI